MSYPVRAYGTDIAFDEDIITGGGGDWAEVEGFACLVQDLRARATDPRGSHFAHPSWGSTAWALLQGPITAETLGELADDLEDALEDDERVESADVTCEHSATDERVVIARCTVVAINAPNPLNLVWGFNLTTLTVETLNAQ